MLRNETTERARRILSKEPIEVDMSHSQEMDRVTDMQSDIENAQQTVLPQIRSQISSHWLKTYSNTLATQIAHDDDSAWYAGATAARTALRKKLKPTIHHHLRSELDQRTTPPKREKLEKISGQEKFIYEIAWRLRHGSSQNFFALYRGPVAEDGITTKIGSFFYNVVTPRSSSFFVQPKPITDGKTDGEVNTVVSEAIRTVVNNL